MNLTAERLRRDLDWCLTSSPLLRGEDWSRFPPADPPIAVLPAPPHLHRFRLGQHFERLLHAWIESRPDIELLGHNLPVRNGKQTVGEFDFLVHWQGEVEHWEAAIKFYLGYPHGHGLGDYYGPNTSDRLDIKLDRLTSHQLRLAKHPAALEVLAARGLDVARSRCFMKGRLFRPWGEETSELPEMINPVHEHGWWLTVADFQQVFADGGDRFVYLPKALWLSPLMPADYEDALSVWEVGEMLTAPGTEQAVHLAVVGEDGERSRGFVVNDEWLTRVNASKADRAQHDDHD